MKKKETKIAENRKARHDYFIEERIECGIVLTGTEVCSLRENSCNLRDCYVLVRKGEAWLNGVYIAPYSHGSVWNVDPNRRRKLLLHKKEILKLEQRSAQQGYTLIPLSMYFKKGRVKVEVGICKGKKEYDKRQSIKERDAKRNIDKTMKSQRYQHKKYGEHHGAFVILPPRVHVIQYPRGSTPCCLHKSTPYCGTWCSSYLF